MIGNAWVSGDATVSVTGFLAMRSEEYNQAESEAMTSRLLTTTFPQTYVPFSKIAINSAGLMQ